jgi:6-phosphogluconate dehydrogenase
MQYRIPTKFRPIALLGAGVLNAVAGLVFVIHDLRLDNAGGPAQPSLAAVRGPDAADSDAPLTLIAESVFARCLSAAKEERLRAAAVLDGSTQALTGERSTWIADLRQALFASKVVSYAQGYQLMRAAAETHGWNLNFGGIALTWRGGCIIRSAFLGDIKRAFDRDPQLVNLLLDPFFKDALAQRQAAWRRVVAGAVQAGIPVPCLSSALAWFDGYRSGRLPANLLQAQRDYFGAHQYERVDRPRGEFFHTDWTGHGGSTTSQAYSR